MEAFISTQSIIQDKTFLWLLESAPDAMLIASADGAILLVNSQFERLFGLSRDDVVSRSIEVLIPERLRNNHEKHRAHYRDNPFKRSMGMGLELNALHHDGSEFPVEISLSPLPIDDSTLTIAAIRDITERRRLNEQRQRELHSIEELAAPTTSVTAGTFGLHPIHKYSEKIFEDLCQKYEHVLDLAMEQRAYKVKHNISELLRSLAMEIGMLKGGPRDVIKIHSTSLGRKVEKTPHEKAQAYLEEGRLLVLELMGHLVTHYRSQIGTFLNK